MESAQRESNPHFRHGKATGCRYIMGAWLEAEFSKTKVAVSLRETIAHHAERDGYHQSTGRESNPRHRSTGAASSPLDHQCSYPVGPVGIEPTSSGLRDRCITLSATVPHQSARRELSPRPASYQDVALTAELSTSTKKPGVFVTPGLGKRDRMVGPSVTNADAAWAGYSPVDRQTARRISVRQGNSTVRPSCSYSPQGTAPGPLAVKRRSL